MVAMRRCRAVSTTESVPPISAVTYARAETPELAQGRIVKGGDRVRAIGPRHENVGRAVVRACRLGELEAGGDAEDDVASVSAEGVSRASRSRAMRSASRFSNPSILELEKGRLFGSAQTRRTRRGAASVSGSGVRGLQPIGRTGTSAAQTRIRQSMQEKCERVRATPRSL